MCDANHEEYDRNSDNTRAINDSTKAIIKEMDEYLKVHSMSRTERLKYEILDFFKTILKSVFKLVGYVVAVVLLGVIIMFAVAMCDGSDNEKQASVANDIQQDIAEQASMEQDSQRGQRDASALYGDMIKDFAGEKALITGIVKNVYIADGDNPSYIDLDYEYPDKRRISIIIWPENLSDRLLDLLNDLEPDEKIFITGKIKIYKGVAQVEVSKPSQIERENE